MTYAVKVRTAGEKRYNFLTPSGGETGLRVHAAQIETLDKAQSIVTQIREENAGFEVVITDFSTGKALSAAQLAQVGQVDAEQTNPDVECAHGVALTGDCSDCANPTGPVANGEQFAPGYTAEAVAYEQSTRPLAPAVPEIQVIEEREETNPLLPDDSLDGTAEAPQQDSTPPADGPQAGEVFHNGSHADTHVVGMVEGLYFKALCERVFLIGDPATPTDQICDYCFMGVAAPADAPKAERRTPRADRPSAVRAEPQFSEELDGLHLQTLRLASLIVESGSLIDARLLLGNLRVSLESVRSTMPKNTPRSIGTPRVTERPIGPKSITVDGQAFPNMAKAATYIAATYATATSCADYVTKTSAGVALNARLSILKDIDAGRIPAGVVVFGDAQEMAA